MAKKPEAPKESRVPSDAEVAADKVRAERKAKRDAKAAAAEAQGGVKKPGMGRPGDGQQNVFGKANASKMAAVSRSIMSRSRGGRGR